METGWKISGLRRVAHYIYEDGEYLKAACGTIWWMSDAMACKPSENYPDIPRCKRCQRSRRVKEHNGY